MSATELSASVQDPNLARANLKLTMEAAELRERLKQTEATLKTVQDDHGAMLNAHAALEGQFRDAKERLVAVEPIIVQAQRESAKRFETTVAKSVEETNASEDSGLVKYSDEQVQAMKELYSRPEAAAHPLKDAIAVATANDLHTRSLLERQRKETLEVKMSADMLAAQLVERTAELNELRRNGMGSFDRDQRRRFVPTDDATAAVAAGTKRLAPEPQSNTNLPPNNVPGATMAAVLASMSSRLATSSAPLSMPAVGTTSDRVHEVMSQHEQPRVGGSILDRAFSS